MSGAWAQNTDYRAWLSSAPPAAAYHGVEPVYDTSTDEEAESATVGGLGPATGTGVAADNGEGESDGAGLTNAPISDPAARSPTLRELVVHAATAGTAGDVSKRGRGEMQCASMRLARLSSVLPRLPATLQDACLIWLPPCDIARVEMTSFGMCVAVERAVPKQLQHAYGLVLARRAVAVAAVSTGAVASTAEGAVGMATMTRTTATLASCPGTSAGVDGASSPPPSVHCPRRIRMGVPSLLPGESNAALALFAARTQRFRLGAVQHTSFSTSSTHGAIVSGSGELCTWGCGRFCRLGHGSDADQPLPRPVAFPLTAAPRRAVHIVSVAVGDAHAAATSRCGRLFTWGGGDWGALGHGDTLDSPRPRRVAALSGDFVAAAAIGARLTAAMTADGRLFTFGSDRSVGPVNAEGLLGQGKTFSRTTSLTLDFSLSRNGEKGTCAGRVFNQGKLCMTRPMRVKSLSHARVRAVSVSDTWAMALCEAGHVYTWGHGAHGQLGHSTRRPELRPKRVRAFDALGVQIMAIDAGVSHAVAVSLEGQLFTWGRECGTLGQAEGNFLRKPTIVNRLSLERVVCASAGHAHTVAVTVPFGAVWLWGAFGAAGDCMSPTPVSLAPSPLPTSSTFDWKAFSPRAIAASAGSGGHTAVIDVHGRLYMWGAWCNKAPSSAPLRVASGVPCALLDNDAVRGRG